MARRRKSKKQQSLLATVIFILIVTGSFVIADLNREGLANTNAEGQMSVDFIDVGQGNATLIQLNGVNTLIDTGKEKAYTALSTYLDEEGIETIDNFIVTHPDSDHMGGADLIIRDYDVRNFYITYYTNDTWSYKEMMRQLYQKNIDRDYLYEGDMIDVGDGGSCQVLSPAKDTYYDDSNSASIVMMLSFGQRKFLLTGDIPAKVEGQIRDKYDIGVDVLQVAHHGSDGSNGVLFLKNTSPEYAVISVGEDNSYGHPRKNVLDRLQKYAGSTLRTDIDGNISFETDGQELTVKTENPSAPVM